MCRRPIDWLRHAAQTVKGLISPIFKTAKDEIVQVVKTTINTACVIVAVSIVDALAALAAKVELTAEKIEREIELILAPLPISDALKDEITGICKKGIALLQAFTEPAIINNLKKGLATEIANILSGKVHDLKTIETDIQSLWDGTIDPSLSQTLGVSAAIEQPGNMAVAAPAS